MSSWANGGVRARSDGSAASSRPLLTAALGVLLVAALVLVPGGERADATSPGRNGKIYFEQSGDIFRISPTGASKTRVIPGRVFSDLVEAVPSPDGRKLAFTANNGGSDLWIKDLTTNRYTNVTQRASDRLTLTSLETPAWSPDGTRLVFQATRSQRSRLYRINVDGTGIRELQYFEDVAPPDLTPDWSSRNTIVFAHEGDLWTMRPDGTMLTNVTADLDRGFERPSWSPDGTKIAAECEPENWMKDDGIMIVTPGATGQKYNYLTGDADYMNSEYIADPAWSPDGRWIVYYGHWAPGSGAFDDYDLWKVSLANPSTPVDLNARAQFGADVYHPSWAVQPPA